MIDHSQDYERIRQILKVEERLTVRRVAALCPDLSLSRVDGILLEMARLEVVAVDREWNEMKLIKEEFYLCL